MKIVCTKSSLLQGVNVALKAVSTKTTLPILECLFLEAKKGIITLTANDMELGIETTIEGNIQEDGQIALNAKLFSEIVRKLPDSDIIIETNKKHQAVISCEKSKFTISGQSGDDFPAIPQIEKDKSITISQFMLKEVIRQTIFSIADNENNMLMTGELFEIADNKLKVVSLDGHRISIRNIELKESYDNMKVVVPGKTLSDLSKILNGGTEDDVNIYFTNKHILFEFDQTIVVSRLIEGEYFNINQMLSSDYGTKIKINKKEFLSCIERASLLIRESDKKPIVIKIEDDTMQLSIQSFIGSMKEEIFINKEGKDLLIGFNPKFLMDALRVIDDETVDIYLVNPKAPCFIKDPAQSYVYLILPVNFNAANI